MIYSRKICVFSLLFNKSITKREREREKVRKREQERKRERKKGEILYSSVS